LNNTDGNRTHHGNGTVRVRKLRTKVWKSAGEGMQCGATEQAIFVMDEGTKRNCQEACAKEANCSSYTYTERSSCYKCMGFSTDCVKTVQTTCDGSVQSFEKGVDCWSVTAKGPCTFPFEYNGRHHYTCITGKAAKGGYWCATETASNNSATDWDYCKPNNECAKDAPPSAPTGFLSLCDSGCAAIIDTGSNIIAGPWAEVAKLSRKLGVKDDCSNLDSLPDIIVKLGAHTFRLPPSGYVMKLKVPSWMKHIWGFRKRGAEHNGGGRGRSWFRKMRAKQPWHQAIKGLAKRHGVDLRAALGLSEDDGWKLPRISAEYNLCMPAVTTVDIMTQGGPLWVIGRPIFVGYYARWSWKYNTTTPSIFFRNVSDAYTCRQVIRAMPNEETGARPGFSSQDNEVETKSNKGVQKSSDRTMMGLNSKHRKAVRIHPTEMEMDDIRHPHWVDNMDGRL
jgi:hypothetical protein